MIIKEEVIAMKHDDLQRIIAGLKGWQVYHYNKDVARRCYYMLVDDEFNPVNVLPDRGHERRVESDCWLLDCPQWHENLLAAYALEEEIPDSEHGFYAQRLADVIEVQLNRKIRWFDLVHADADQRARAYIMWKVWKNGNLEI